MVGVVPIILAGGKGTRLWPLSRKSYPKQFVHLIDDKTLFQKTALRLESSEILELNPKIIVTNADFRVIVAEQLKAIKTVTSNILIEPEEKNTVAAILQLHWLLTNKTPKQLCWLLHLIMLSLILLSFIV